MKDEEHLGLTAKIVSYFIDSKLTPIFILVSLFLGLFAILKTPKDEEPQIVVPMIDIIIQYPGAEPAEIEKRIIFPLREKSFGSLKILNTFIQLRRKGLRLLPQGSM